MSKCSKKCNEICEKIQSISGLDDNYVYDKLEAIDNIISALKDFYTGTMYKGMELDREYSLEELRHINS